MTVDNDVTIQIRVLVAMLKCIQLFEGIMRYANTYK